jgi:2-methylcitrate dehydratase PrpD
MEMHIVGEQDLRSLAAFASGLDIQKLGDALLSKAKGCLLYGLAVALASTRVPAVHSICTAIDSDGAMGVGGATRLLDGKPESPGNAALANGVLLSARVQGDSHPCGHLGGVLIPAALAVAQHRQLSGIEMLSSMIAGYETATRIGRDHAEDLTRRGFRTTPCYGVFAAAAASSNALRLDAQATQVALSLAANLAGGLREHVNAGTEESPFQAGFAAQNGLKAAMLAASGVTEAACSALHGPAGFYSAFGGDRSRAGKRLCSDLGTDFEFRKITYKPYPSCQFLRSMIAGLGVLRQQASNCEVEAIEVRLHPFEANFVGVRFMGPFTNAAQTVMSAPFCAALAWLTSTTSYAALRNLTDPEVLRVVSRVVVIDDDTLPRYHSRLRVVLQDGRVLERAEDGESSAYELTWDSAVRATKLLCGEAGTADEAVRGLVDTVNSVDRLTTVWPIIDAVRAAITSSKEPPLPSLASRPA